MKRHETTYALLIFLSTLLWNVPKVDALNVTPVPFERPNVISFHIDSEFVEPVMLVEVALPVGYSPEKAYPVMYFTDGLSHFPLLASNNFLLSQGDAELSPPWIPEIITVGIDFVVPLDELDRMRLTYLTPTRADDEDYGRIGGEADRLLDFLRFELKPFIDATLSTDTDQELLAGHSLGGLFSLYALFSQPDLFEKFIAASPSIYWDDEVLYELEDAYHSSHPTEPERLFLSVGTREDPFGITLDYVWRFGQHLHARSYDNLTLKRKLFRGHNHNSVVANAYAVGTRFIFRDTEPVDRPER